MEDEFWRLTIAYVLCGGAVAVASAWWVAHRRQAYWKKLRAQGDARAKVRELERKRRR